jgi:hypothetical protein
MSPASVENKSEPEINNPAGERPSPHEAALLAALREFIRHAGDPPKEPEKRLSLLQWVVLALFVVDAALLYSELERWFDNPILAAGLKILPWFLGATAFASSEKVRDWLLAQCQRVGVGVFAGVLLLPLLLLRQPIFSIKVQVDSDSIEVKADDKSVSVYREGRVFLVRRLTLTETYSVRVEDTPQPASKAYALAVGRWRVARGTFRQIPLVGWIFGDPTLILTPLYQVPTYSSAAGAYADIEGQFQEGFFQQDSAIGRCSRTATTTPKAEAIRCSLDDGVDALNLPHGSYKITLYRGKCKKILSEEQKVAEGKNSTLNFDEECPQ